MTNKEKHENNIYISKDIMPENFVITALSQTVSQKGNGDEICCPYCKKTYTIEEKNVLTLTGEEKHGLFEGYLQKRFLFFKYKKKVHTPLKVYQSETIWECPTCGEWVHLGYKSDSIREVEKENDDK